jgi:hypothetical protein
VTYGGESGNRIFVLYWRCPLIRVSVIRGSTVLKSVDRVNILLKTGKNYWALYVKTNICTVFQKYRNVMRTRNFVSFAGNAHRKEKKNRWMLKKTMAKVGVILGRY